MLWNEFKTKDTEQEGERFNETYKDLLKDQMTYQESIALERNII